MCVCGVCVRVHICKYKYICIYVCMYYMKIYMKIRENHLLLLLLGNNIYVCTVKPPPPQAMKLYG